VNNGIRGELEKKKLRPTVMMMRTRNEKQKQPLLNDYL
jgi:hypothetical protein